MKDYTPLTATRPKSYHPSAASCCGNCRHSETRYYILYCGKNGTPTAENIDDYAVECGGICAEFVHVHAAGGAK